MEHLNLEPYNCGICNKKFDSELVTLITLDGPTFEKHQACPDCAEVIRETIQTMGRNSRR